MIELSKASKNSGFRMNGYWVWCSSVIRAEDGLYHMFASRWPRHYPFHPGWLLNSEVVRAVSSSPEGPYTFSEVVLPSRGAEFWDGCMTHNPMITKHNDKYILFYTGSRHPFKPLEINEKSSNDDPRTIVARSNKRTGIAVADSIYGPWTRFNEPVLATAPKTFYSFLTSNACPVPLPDGSLDVFFKSRRYIDYKHSDMMIGVATARSWEGPYSVSVDKPLFGPGNLGEIEDPFVWLDGTGEYNMVAKDMTGDMCGEKFGGVYACSDNGIDWNLGDKPKAYSRTVVWDNNDSTEFALLERPFVLIENNIPITFFAAVANKYPYTDENANTWNIAIPIMSQKKSN